MGATYVLPQSANANASDKNFITIVNQTGSGKLVRIWRVWISNAQTASITGGISIIRMGRCNANYSGGTVITSSIVSMDSANAALPSQIVATTGSTGLTINGLLRQIALITDEFAVSDNTGDVLNNVPALSCYLDLGYYNSDLQPFVIAENEGFTIQHAGSLYANNNTAGSFHFLIEFDVV